MEKKEITGYRIGDSKKGLSASFVDVGAALTELLVPLPDGTTRDVVLGFEEPEGYRNNIFYLGTTMAPCANRIGGAAFTLNGKRYELEKNDGECSLHCGDHALHTKFWDLADITEDSLTFTADCADGDYGLPGPLHIDAAFRIRGNELFVDYHATAGQDTLFNPAHHSYFCLGGDLSQMAEHVLTIYSDQYTPAVERVPDGSLKDVAGTPYDFRTAKKIGEHLHDAEPSMVENRGYDQNYVLRKSEELRAPEYDANGLEIYHAAQALSPAGDMVLDVYTDLPCLQFYTANWLNTPGGKGGVDYTPQIGFCLETQFCPNAINIPDFTQPVIRAGESVHHRTVYTFRNI